MQENMQDETIIIGFRVDIEDVILFKKYQILLEEQKNKKLSAGDTFLLLLQRAKDFLIKEKAFLEADADKNFLERFTSTGKKKRKILHPKKLQIIISREGKKLYNDVSYSIITKDGSEDFSYPNAFKKILTLNENLVL